MLPHQQRVVDEKKELEEKLTKLTKFIESDKFSELVPDEYERRLLVMQEDIMSDYVGILIERIDNFTNMEIK